jgi:hypothetical protein
MLLTMYQDKKGQTLSETSGKSIKFQFNELLRPNFDVSSRLSDGSHEI